MAAEMSMDRVYCESGDDRFGTMTCVILQPSYIPWRGYFHQIRRADTFVFYDDVNYDKHGWRNRNRVKTPNGVQWLTIPVTATPGRQLHESPINQVRISDRNWGSRHWKTLVMAYSKAPYFKHYASLLEPCFHPVSEMLVDTTVPLTQLIARELGICQTRFLRSSDMVAQGHKTERLIAILKAVGADHYISGPSARQYLDARRFCESGITLEYMTYDYPEYGQLYPPFDPAVSILDLLFMIGPDASRHIWGSESATSTEAAQSASSGRSAIASSDPPAGNENPA